MQLFSHPKDPSRNYLPQDGTVNYHGTIIPEQKAISYYTIL